MAVDDNAENVPLAVRFLRTLDVDAGDSGGTLTMRSPKSSAMAWDCGAPSPADGYEAAGCGTAGKEVGRRLDRLALGRPIQAVEDVTRKLRATLIPFRPYHQP